MAREPWLPGRRWRPPTAFWAGVPEPDWTAFHLTLCSKSQRMPKHTGAALSRPQLLPPGLPAMPPSAPSVAPVGLPASDCRPDGFWPVVLGLSPWMESLVGGLSAICREAGEPGGGRPLGPHSRTRERSWKVDQKSSRRSFFSQTDSGTARSEVFSNLHLSNQLWTSARRQMTARFLFRTTSAHFLRHPMSTRAYKPRSLHSFVIPNMSKERSFSRHSASIAYS
mmetsp:Transcript_39424/g.104006  ORF Transcript_39424/g.104006 Transcript_39424/m.104006 type:complete len:224 (-) Transcript_39424:536-1207(-)